MTLIELYNKELEDYYDTGERNHPSNLLALLLLNKKDEFEPLKVNEGEFYDTYRRKLIEELKRLLRILIFLKRTLLIISKKV